MTPATQEGKTMAESKAKAAAAEGGGVKDEVEAAHEARTSVPGVPGVDARLDNRQPQDRAPRASFPAVPQQVDGPDIEHQAEFTRAHLAKLEKADYGDRVGAHSPGPHGLSDEDARKGTDRAEESGGKTDSDGDSGNTAVDANPKYSSRRYH